MSEEIINKLEREKEYLIADRDSWRAQYMKLADLATSGAFTISYDTNQPGLIELMAKLLEWYDERSPYELCTVHPPGGSGAGKGLYNLSNKEIVTKFLKHREEIKKMVDNNLI